MLPAGNSDPRAARAEGTPAVPSARLPDAGWAAGDGGGGEGQGRDRCPAGSLGSRRRREGCPEPGGCPRRAVEESGDPEGSGPGGRGVGAGAGRGGPGRALGPPPPPAPAPRGAGAWPPEEPARAGARSRPSRRQSCGPPPGRGREPLPVGAEVDAQAAGPPLRPSQCGPICPGIAVGAGETGDPGAA